jgi:hypothetical protein
MVACLFMAVCLHISPTKAATFTYSEMNAEKVGLKQLTIENQADEVFTIGFVSLKNNVVSSKKIS